MSEDFTVNVVAWLLLAWAFFAVAEILWAGYKLGRKYRLRSYQRHAVRELTALERRRVWWRK